MSYFSCTSGQMSVPREARKRYFQTRFRWASLGAAGLDQPPAALRLRRPPSASTSSCRLRRRPLADHAHAHCRQPQSPSALTALPPHNSAARQPPTAQLPAKSPPNRPPSRRRRAPATRRTPAMPLARRPPRAPTWAARPARPPNRPPNRPPTNHTEPPTGKQPAAPAARPPIRPLRDCRAACQPPAGHRHSCLR